MSGGTMSVPMVILAVYAVMMTGFWFIALSGAKKQRNDMLLEVEDFQNRERKVSEKAEAEKAVLKGLVDGLREKNEELTNQIGAIGGAIDSIVEEIAMMKFKENPEMLHDAIQRLSSSADELLVVVDQIEDYEAVANFTRQIEAVQKKMRGYVDLWEKNLRGVV
jgi:hypothetical protein